MTGDIIINAVYIIILVFCIVMILLPPQKMPNMDKNLSEKDLKQMAKKVKIFYLFLFIINAASLVFKLILT